MRLIHRKLCAGILALIMTLGQIPLASASNVNIDQLVSDCNVALSEILGAQNSDSAEGGLLAGCVGHPDCTLHCGCAPLQFANLLFLAAQVVAHRSTPIEVGSIITPYPEVPERPPKI